MRVCRKTAALAGAFTAAVLAVGGAASAGEKMPLIAGGEYRPLYADGADLNGDGKIPLASFRLDAEAVSNGDFLAFVRAHPKWRKSRVKRIFADPNYLSHWRDDLHYAAAESAPVVNVSWFAARAFCRARGATLPTTAQWEYAAAADERTADAGGDPAFVARILAWYSRPRAHTDGVPRFRNVHGIYDLHGSVWEWVLDFNTALTSGESRADASRDRRLYCAGGVVGAATYTDYPSFLRHGYRSSLDGRYTHGELGFRCAASAG